MSGFGPTQSAGSAGEVRKDGTTVGTAPAINFIEGANITITAAQDDVNQEIDVTIAAGGGGAAIDVKEEGGAAMTVSSIDFVGSMTTVSAVGAAGTLTTAHGAQAGGSTHADVVSGGASGFMTGADKAKLDGIAASATNGISTQDEGVAAGSNQTTLNFVGAGVTAAAVGATTTVTIPGGISDGDKGDITVSASGATWTIDNGAVTAAKIASMTSAELATILSDETGTAGSAVFSASPTFTGPNSASVAVGTSNAGLNILGPNVASSYGIWAQGRNASSCYGLVAAHTNTGGGSVTTLANGVLGRALDGDGVTGETTGAGTAVKATATGTGYALSVTGDTTSPVKAPIFIAPANAAPSGAAVVGDIYVGTGGIAYICTAAGTPGTWTRLADTHSAFTGDVTTSADSNVTAIAASAVTLAKMADLAQDQFIGRVTASTGVPETATITAAARTVLDDTTTAAMLTTLGGIGGSTGSTDNALVRANGTGGATLQSTNVIVDDSDGLYGHTETQNVQSGTTYTMAAGDCGKAVIFTSGSAVTVTVPQTLTAGWHCRWEQRGAGKVSFNGVAVTAANLRCRSSGHVASAGQYAVGGLACYTSGTPAEVTLFGDTGT